MRRTRAVPNTSDVSCDDEHPRRVRGIAIAMPRAPNFLNSRRVASYHRRPRHKAHSHSSHDRYSRTPLASDIHSHHKPFGLTLDFAPPAEPCCPAALALGALALSLRADTTRRAIDRSVLSKGAEALWLLARPKAALVSPLSDSGARHGAKVRS
ncbi:uncharacterized protein M421DRAFT_242517 [Didymella exigua CBS 183.55]|uniref:Uncharacterized protein n=1 Tax=Didymella exigua CBS 183.55 TaxID=1150837 RepID=A0A6A5RB31_9PLEO|nr:uncharacterized protein M421DRAFT_242517 [Didymella exigua CBS 183.55]KAF1925445.1 hypothetical protein M421DRAFT_242517 [Didymella exigua CBS 183.55]